MRFNVKNYQGFIHFEFQGIVILLDLFFRILQKFSK